MSANKTPCHITDAIVANDQAGFLDDEPRDARTTDEKVADWLGEANSLYLTDLLIDDLCSIKPDGLIAAVLDSNPTQIHQLMQRSLHAIAKKEVT